MNPTLELNFWLRLLGTLALEISLVVGLAFATQTFIRSAFWRRAIWQITFVCLLLAAGAELTGVGRGISVWLAGKPAAERKVSVRLIPSQKKFLLSPTEMEIPEPVFIPQNEMPVARSVWWPGILWLAGFGLIAVRIFCARIFLTLLRWRKPKITDKSLLSCVTELAPRLGLRRKIHLLETPGLSSPMTFGLVWPTIGLPSCFAQKFSLAQQNAMLAHELAHLAARDPLWYLLADVTAALLWWQPLAWWARRRLHSTSEHAADEAAALLENGPGTLAECLVNLSQQLSRPRSFGWLGADGSGFRSHLGQRVERLLNLKEASQPLRGWKIFFAKASLTILFAAVVIFTSGWIQNKEEPHEKDLPTSVQKSWKSSCASTALAAWAAERTQLMAKNEKQKASIAPKSVSDAPPKSDGSDEVKGETNVTASALIQDGKLLLEMGKLDEAEAKLNLALEVDAENKAARYYKSFVEKAKRLPRPRVELLHPTIPLTALDKTIVDVPPVKSVLPGSPPRTNLIYTSKGRKSIKTKLDVIRLPEVWYDGLPLGDVLRSLKDESKKRDAEDIGINFGWNPHAHAPLPRTNTASAAVDLNQINVRITPALKNLRLADVLDAVVMMADAPIEYEVQDYGVVFSPRAEVANTFYSRTFKVNPTTFRQGLESVSAHVGSDDKTRNQDFIVPGKGQEDGQGGNKVSSVSKTNLQARVNRMVRDYFTAAGVDFGAVPTATPATGIVTQNGKALFYNERTGLLMVRASLQDLEIIQTAIEVLNTDVPQIVIETKFAEIGAAASKTLGFDWVPGNAVILTTNKISKGLPSTFTNLSAVRPDLKERLTNALSATVTGILTESQFKTALKSLERTSGADILSAPRVTTLSGRQAQVSVLDLVRVVTGVSSTKNLAGVSSNTFQTQTLPFGPALDILPSVSADGYTIQMTLIATVTEFLGYDKPDKNLGKLSPGDPSVTAPLPRMRIRQLITAANVWDGQTIVLGGLMSDNLEKIKHKVPVLGDLPFLGRLFRSESSSTVKKNLLIFVTPTIIDPAGNRVHSEDELRFTTNSAPKQPEQK